MCRRELQLNRRFSPDVYLGLEEVVGVVHRWYIGVAATHIS